MIYANMGMIADKVKKDLKIYKRKVAIVVEKAAWSEGIVKEVSSATAEMIVQPFIAEFIHREVPAPGIK